MNATSGSIEALRWDGALLHLGDATLHAAHEADAEHPAGTLPLRKTRWLVEAILHACEPLQPRRILELGTHEGASAILWHEFFEPEKLVTVDLAPGPGVPALADYARLRPYWGVDQANGKRLLEIVEAEFDGPLDLVIDDASHLYEPTRASFQVLFPLLRPRGLYLIEDWNWELMPNFQRPHPWADETGLVSLVDELVRRIASDVASIQLRRALAVVERATTSA